MLLQSPLGQQLAMTLILRKSLALKADIRQEGRRRASDEHLDRLFRSALPHAFPHVPPLGEQLIDMVLLELNGDEHSRWAVKDGVGAHEKQLAQLGPHTTGVGCIYFKDLEDVDLRVLERIVKKSYATLTAGTYGSRARDGSSRR